ncbi:hypothetical protein [Alishewanella sp. HH-ZS]|uniref:hypothetical protein n=1 Tax=Alishewanella sp. HH-ZS TaxID=1856684 RepID=UPI000A6C19FB|nr:hypothetical protein [Alishewanella sp. HH-ZS]
MTDKPYSARRPHRSNMLGTDENPIMLVPESAHRPKLVKHLLPGFIPRKPKDEKKADKTSDGLRTNNGGIDLNKWGSSERNYYIENVVNNKFLSHLETKLALYLYSIFTHKGEFYYPGYIFIVRDTPDYSVFNRRFDDYICVYGYHQTEELHYYIAGFFDLFKRLELLFVEDYQKELSNALDSLHDFGYITVTDIVEENLYSNRHPKTSAIPKIDTKAVKRKPRLKHIRIGRWMVHTPYWTKLLLQVPSEPSIPQKPKSAKKAEEAADIVKS